MLLAGYESTGESVSPVSLCIVQFDKLGEGRPSQNIKAQSSYLVAKIQDRSVRYIHCQVTDV
jgi:hypothetical protein